MLVNSTSLSLGMRGFSPPTQLLMILKDREWQVLQGYWRKCNKVLLPMGPRIFEYYRNHCVFILVPGLDSTSLITFQNQDGKAYFHNLSWDFRSWHSLLTSTRT